MDVCVKDFEFYVITDEDGLNGNDGILGLSPINERQNGPSYVKELYEQGEIDEEIASFWLNSYGDALSYVTLGGVPPQSTVGETFK